MSKGTSGAVPGAAGFVIGALVGGFAMHTLDEHQAAIDAQRAEMAAAVARVEADLTDAAVEVLSEDAGVSLEIADARSGAWTYHELRDEMRDTVRDVACTRSTSGEPAQLCVRTAYEDDPDIFVTLYAGTVGCGFNGCRVAASFDADGVTSWRATRGEGGDGVFIQDGGGFVRELLDAQRLIVEVDVYERIPQQTTFVVAGLDWARPPAPRLAPRPRPRCVDLLAEGRTGDCD